MKRRLFLFGFAVSVFALTGCGGGGSVTSPSTTTRVTKQEILTAVEQGFASKQQGQSGVSGASGATRATRAESLAFYNEFYELWVLPVEGGEDFFIDAALTQPAGKRRYFYTTGEQGQFTKGSTVEITAGPQKGYTETINVIVDSTGLRYEFQGTSPEFGPFSTIGSSINGVTSIKNGFRDAQGNTRYYDIEYRSDSTTKVRYNNDKLFNIELSYTSEGTGTGTVTGSSELLPATVTWDRDGTGTITFKDGSTQSFTDFRFDI
jgi:hypothetical protein